MRYLALVAASFWLNGCYLLQAARGQAELIVKAESIEQMLESQRGTPERRGLLAEVPRVKRFAVARGLNATRNYSSFVELDRKAAVWVVAACESLSFTPRTWGFPIVGSFTYLGWFDEGDARAYGETLKAEGWDVYVRPASAYSTLGWFRDPILSTMLSSGDAARGRLVDTVIHESVHASIYINGQSTFNESLANFIAHGLTEEYLRTNYGQDSTELRTYLERRQRRRVRAAQLKAAYVELDRVYKSDLSDEQKRANKARVLDGLQNFGSVNNARLIQFQTYGQGGDAFQRLFLRCDQNWSRFIDSAGAIGAKDFPVEQMDVVDGVIDRVRCP